MIPEPVARVAPAAATHRVLGPPAFDHLLAKVRQARGEGAPDPLSGASRPAPTFPVAAPGAAPVDAPPPVPPESLAGPVLVSHLADVAAAVRADLKPASVAVPVSAGIDLELTRTEDGVAVRLETSPTQTFPVQAELPRIVGALRARGIAVVSAAVQTVPGRGRARGGAR